MRSPNIWKKLSFLKKKFKSFSTPQSSKIAQIKPNIQPNSPNIPPWCKPKKQFWAKNYVNLISLIVRRKPINRFWVCNRNVKKTKIKGLTPKRTKSTNKKTFFAKWLKNFYSYNLAIKVKKQSNGKIKSRLELLI